MRMREFFSDPLIPRRDKTLLIVFVILLISPVDLIPDWILGLGQIDDLVLAALIFDYFFGVLAPEDLARHWPFGPGSLKSFRALAAILSRFIPRRLRRWIWAYR
jgi:hypothetical protein